MKKKELKNLAKKIAKAEVKLRQAISNEEKKLLEDTIMTLTGKVTNINEMIELDDLIQEEIAELDWLSKIFLILYLHNKK